MQRKKYQILSSSALKLIAVIAMTIDHISYIMSAFGYRDQPKISGYPLLKIIGRIAFPLFAFMIAEGAKHTRDINKYIFRMFVFALISEIPFDIAFNLISYKQVIEFTYQNVFFTLCLGLTAIKFYQIFEERNAVFLSVVTTLICAFAAYFLRSDYGWSGVICIFIMYVVSDAPQYVRIPGCMLAVTATVFSSFIFNKPQLFCLLGIIPIALYNGQKGFKMNKYFFYAYYPAHILIIYFIIRTISMR